MGQCPSSQGATLPYTTTDGSVYSCDFYNSPDATACYAKGSTLGTFRQECNYTVPSTSAYNFVIPCDLGSKSPDGSSGKSAPVAVVVVGGQGSGLEIDGSSFIHYTTYEANGAAGATVSGAFKAGRFPSMNLTIGVGLGGGAAGSSVAFMVGGFMGTSVRSGAGGGFSAVSSYPQSGTDSILATVVVAGGGGGGGKKANSASRGGRAGVGVSPQTATGRSGESFNTGGGLGGSLDAPGAGTALPGGQNPAGPSGNGMEGGAGTGGHGGASKASCGGGGGGGYFGGAAGSLDGGGGGGGSSQVPIGFTSAALINRAPSVAVSFAAQNCKLVSGPPKVAKKSRAHAKRSNMQTILKFDPQCQPSHRSCPLTKRSFVCIERSDITSCGGCVSDGTGVDCLSHAGLDDSVECINDKCVTSSRA